jgi:hypothetical protein
MNDFTAKAITWFLLICVLVSVGSCTVKLVAEVVK